MSTALSSRVFEVCLQIVLKRSITNLFTAVVVQNFNNIGFKSFSIIILCYFPNITKMLVLDKILRFYGRTGEKRSTPEIKGQHHR